MDNNIQVLPAEEDSMAITDLSSGLAFDEEMLRQFGYQIMDEVASYLSGIRERPGGEISAWRRF